MSHSTWHTPSSPHQANWEGRRDQYFSREDPRSRQHFYPTPPQSARSSSSSTIPRLPPRPQKKHWPPSPFVEDEFKSISREHRPVTSQQDEVPLRGSKNQFPIVLEAGALSDDEDLTSMTSKKEYRTDSSSTESSGPKTPSEDSQLNERRFIFVPKRDDHQGSDDEDQGRRGSYVRVRNGHNPPSPVRTKSPPREKSSNKMGLKIDSKAPIETPTLPYTGPRGSTPYSFTPDTAKSKFPGDYLLSPETMTPNRNFPAAQAQLRGRQNHLRNESMEHHRTLSGSHVQPEQRPIVSRNLSAMGASNDSPRSASYEPAPRREPDGGRPAKNFRRTISPFRDLKDRDVFDSDSETDSDISPDDMFPPRRRRRNTQYSMTASELRQNSANLKESMRKAKPEPIHTGSQSQSQQPRYEPSSSQTPGSAPLQSYSSSNTAPSTPEMIQKRTVPHSKPEFNNNGSRTNSAGSYREPLKSFVASPPSSGSVTRPGSRGGSKPNSRPSTPETLHHPIWHSTLNVPMEQKQHINNSTKPVNKPPSRPSTPSNTHIPTKIDSYSRIDEDFKRQPVPRSRHTSPLPSPKPDKGRSDEARLDSEGSTTNAKSRIFPVETRKAYNKETSNIQPSPKLPNASRLVPETIEKNGRRSIDPQSPRTSMEIPRSPIINFKPTLRRRPVSGFPGLPACPRPHLVTGYKDWSTLPGHPDFDVCPTCRDALEDGGFEDQFIPSPHLSDNYSTRCDLSVTWVRMAWLLLLQDRAKDRNIVNNMTRILAHEQPCPGRQLSQRPWHRLYDPDGNRYLPDFDACPACIKSLEQLFPNLRGAFHPIPYPTAAENARTCDLRMDSHRFARYVDLLESISTQAAENRREPNMQRFVQLARQLSSIRECRRDDQLFNTPWHYPPNIPDFTVCEECYRDVVWPAVKKGSEVAGMFNRTLQLPPLPQAQIGLSCQLYSHRMRDIFKDAVQRGDWRGLREKILARVTKERELQRRHSEIQIWKDDDARLEEGRRLVREWTRWE